MEKKYLIDGEPVEWTEIIKRAKKYGYNDVIKLTSKASNILREHGHTVEENLESLANQ